MITKISNNNHYSSIRPLSYTANKQAQLNKYNTTDGALFYSDKAVSQCSKAIAFGSCNTENLNFPNFVTEYKKTHPGLSYLEFIKQNAVAENLLGVGKHGSVYSLPKLDNYVMKIPHSLAKTMQDIQPDSNEAVFHRAADPNPGQNYGQAIAENNLGVEILRKVNGEPNSIPDWMAKLVNPESLTKEDAQLFLTKLKKLEEMPFSTFVSLAQSAKELKGANIDHIAANNFLIDYPNNKINITDLMVLPAQHENLREHVIFPLVDVFAQTNYARLLDEEDKKDLIQTTASIMDKFDKAADAVGYKKGGSKAYLELATTFFARHDDNPLGRMLVQNCNDFMKLYNLI